MSDELSLAARAIFFIDAEEKNKKEMRKSIKSPSAGRIRAPSELGIKHCGS
jgi:hypothetical protein